MYSSARGDNDAAEPSASAEQANTRLSVADILSSMASTVDTTATGTTTFSTLDGLTSGIPTRTTPTLTPTTLKNIEESFLDLQTIPPAPMEHQHQAGFVPPVVNISVSTSGGSSLPYHPSSKNDDDDLWLSSCVQSSGELSPSSSVYQSDTAPCTTTTTTVTSKARNVGGRRPAKNDSLTPEEEERRRVRRERNKLAAARCRKRRMDHTNSLLKETEGLEAKKECLQQEIQILKSQKEELEFLLEAHKATCKMIKHHHHSNTDTSLSSDSAGRGGNAGSPARKRGGANRPTSLPVSSAFGTTQQDSLKPSVSMSSETGVPISTPSTGIFNFESLMEGGIGLTPVSTELTLVVSSCSGQQRNSSSDLSSPDGVNPPKLVSL